MNINRIFCIGRNYAEHVKELGNEPDASCVVFMKPPSCVVPVGRPIVLPRGRGPVHHEAELVVRLSGGGADVAPEQALRHVGHLTLGLDLTLRELQNELKKKGAPWELCKAFDGSAPLGDWVRYEGQDVQALEFSCTVGGTLRQRGNTRDMLFPVARQIHILSKTWRLADGDLIYTGTPAGVGPLLPGDRVALESAAIGRFEWTCE
ncbi:MAG: fumarylacetoacetate hydrolase family protein [Gammaproteobacteria bacterium]|nr:fumarylacetoacetate hydrolase family protein [Gammaproteobacteria bacterium]